MGALKYYVSTFYKWYVETSQVYKIYKTVNLYDYLSLLFSPIATFRENLPQNVNKSTCNFLKFQNIKAKEHVYMDLEGPTS